MLFHIYRKSHSSSVTYKHTRHALLWLTLNIFKMLKGNIQTGLIFYDPSELENVLNNHINDNKYMQLD